MNRVFEIARHRRKQSVRHHDINPYGLCNYIVLLTGLLLIVLVVLDWVVPSGPRAAQLGVENANRTIPQIIRGSILLLMLGYIGLTGWDPGAYGFVPGRALFLLAAYMLLSVFFYASDLNSRLLCFSKSLLWIAVAIASYRLVLGGYLTIERIRYLAGIVVVIASVYTIPFCLDSGRRTGQNADFSTLLWCIPLLLLARPPFWALGLAGLGSIAVLVTVKRGAMLALLVGGLVFSALLIHISSREHKVRDFVIVGLIIAVIAAGFLWQWENLEHRIEEDFDRGVIGSDRGSYYPVIIEEWYNSGPFSLLFGKGFFTVPDTLDSSYGVRRYAHSDWLEILHDMGLLGIALFAYLHSRILLIIGQALWQRDIVTPALAMGYCAFALRNVYSHCVVGEATTIYFGLLLGYSAAVVERRRKRTTSK